VLHLALLQVKLPLAQAQLTLSELEVRRAGGVVAAGAGDATGGVVGGAAGETAGCVVRSATRETTRGVVRSAAGNAAGGVMRAGARDSAACGVRAGDTASGRRVTVAGGGETAVVRVYARIGFVSHVRGVGTARCCAGAVGVAGTVRLVRVRVASQAAVRACNAAVRASQASAVRSTAVRTVTVLADWKAAGGGNGATVLKTLVGTADETASLPSTVVKSIRVEATVVVMGVGGGVSGRVRRIAVGVAMVARVRINSGIELVEHVGVMWAYSFVVLHLLRLRLNSWVYDIRGVAGVGTQSVGCRAGRAVILPDTIRTRRRAVQRSVSVRGGVRVRLAAAEVGVTSSARSSAQRSGRRASVAGAVAARADSVCKLAVAAANSTEMAPVRVDSRIGLVGHARGMRS